MSGARSLGAGVCVGGGGGRKVIQIVFCQVSVLETAKGYVKLIFYQRGGKTAITDETIEGERVQNAPSYK